MNKLTRYFNKKPTLKSEKESWTLAGPQSDIRKVDKFLCDLPLPGSCRIRRKRRQGLVKDYSRRQAMGRKPLNNGKDSRMPIISTFYGIIIQMYWRDTHHRISMRTMQRMK